MSFGAVLAKRSNITLADTLRLVASDKRILAQGRARRQEFAERIQCFLRETLTWIVA